MGTGVTQTTLAREMKKSIITVNGDCREHTVGTVKEKEKGRDKERKRGKTTVSHPRLINLNNSRTTTVYTLCLTATELLENQIMNYLMMNIPTGVPATLLENQMMNYQQQHNRNQRGDWYGNSNSNSAQAMKLFLMNPSHDQSPSSRSSSSSTLHMLLPNTVPSSSPTLHHQQSFGSTSGSGQGQLGPSTQFTWVPPGGGTTHVDTHTHGLSLSLSSTFQNLEGAKFEDLRISDDPATAMLYFNQGSDPYRNLQLQGGGGGGVMGPTHHLIHVGYGSSSLGVVKALRTSRSVKAAQELLEEFCSVGRGYFKINNKSGSKHNPNKNPSNDSGGGGGASSATSKDHPPLSSAERIEHQRRKSKLLSMLDEVDRRYNHYCEQMQMMVNSFDLVLGFGAAVPYTSLAKIAISRHFRCLKDAIAAQWKHSCELLGEKDVGVCEDPKVYQEASEL